MLHHSSYKKFLLRFVFFHTIIYLTFRFLQPQRRILAKKVVSNRELKFENVTNMPYHQHFKLIESDLNRN
jgi:hypothetical protein